MGIPPELALARLRGRLFALGVRYVTALDARDMTREMVFFDVATKKVRAVLEFTYKDMVTDANFDETFLVLVGDVYRHVKFPIGTAPPPLAG